LESKALRDDLNMRYKLAFKEATLIRKENAQPMSPMIDQLNNKYGLIPAPGEVKKGKKLAKSTLY
jgi:hypothetical protein